MLLGIPDFPATSGIALIDSSIWFQLELKGLANVGRGVLDFLGNEFQAYGEP